MRTEPLHSFPLVVVAVVVAVVVVRDSERHHYHTKSCRQQAAAGSPAERWWAERGGTGSKVPTLPPFLSFLQLLGAVGYHYRDATAT